MSTTTTERDVDGYTSADPVADEDWLDEVRWQVNRNWQEKPFHNRDGYMCEEAGSPECLALGHQPDTDGDWNDDEHPSGWGYEPVCPATQYGSACSECESDDCSWTPTDSAAFWELFTMKEAH